MPSYVKFLKDILVKRRRLNDFKTVALKQVISDLFKNGVLEKMTDPRSFTVPCSIERMELGRALCDLGGVKFLFPEDFVVPDYKADQDIPIIKGNLLCGLMVKKSSSTLLLR
ncbi:putative lrr receptor-like serinethreonine-protein kinase [Cucumis melo var. makuwa]|uniref:Lrr receptor-like serinethreonine-protein kinase n=1 Tax=Cucumis melo var. makuwa TaxID=1194695 RepID=A0A5D3E0R2_CUCMM|nr:putative lrr receptor-like serinethreonine-protein kinase [Cucumis melo var. makuwa]TYK29100.1 putative lrr receptor-like serinethreonine-protein kinase [Cucumis melo var. makuwa]